MDPETTDSGTTLVLPEEATAALKTIQVGVEKIRTNDVERAAALTVTNSRLTAVEEKLVGMGTTLPGLEDYAKSFSFARAFRAIVLEARPDISAEKAWKDASFEREVFEQAAKVRTQGTEDDVLGGYTLPVQISDSFIDLMYAATVLDKVGVTRISGLKGTLQVNGLGSGATAFWHGEGQIVNESDPTWLTKQLRPHELTSWVKVQNQLLIRSPLGMEARLRDTLARAIALKLDLAGLEGLGSEFEPTGVKGTTGVQTLSLGTDGGEFDYSHIVDFEELLENQNIPTDGAKLIFSHKVKKLLKQKRIAQFSGQADGNFIILPMSDANLRDTLGYDFHTSSQIPTDETKGSGTNLTTPYFGQWREMIAAVWQSISFAASGEASQGSSSAWLQNQTWLKVTGGFDYGFFHPEAIVMGDKATTVAAA